MKAGLGSGFSSDVLVAKLETHRAVGRPVGFADQLGVPLWRELGCDASAYSAVTKVLADRMTRDGQQALRRCRSHSPSGHQSEPADLWRVGGRRLGRTALPTGLVSSRRHIEPCMRFSRTRLTDAFHRRHSVGPA
jgi:hypothetical protein